MSRKGLQKQRLDRLERRLYQAAKLQPEELKKIVAAPQLYDSIAAKIKAKPGARKSKGFTGRQAISSVWIWQRVGIAFAILAFLAGAVGVTVISRQSSLSPSDEQAPATEIQAQLEPIETLQPPNHGILSKPQNTKNRIPGRKAVFKNQAVQMRRSVQKLGFTKRQASRAQAEGKALGEFYRITFTGNLNEEAEDLKIVRTELSRLTLVALGVNLPLENQSAKIKADLLTGSDGLVRAIRFVK